MVQCHKCINRGYSCAIFSMPNLKLWSWMGSNESTLMSVRIQIFFKPNHLIDWCLAKITYVHKNYEIFYRNNHFILIIYSHLPRFRQNAVIAVIRDKKYNEFIRCFHQFVLLIFPWIFLSLSRWKRKLTSYQSKTDLFLGLQDKKELITKIHYKNS